MFPMCVRYDSFREGWFIWTKRGEIELRPNHPAVLFAESIFPGKSAPIALWNSEDEFAVIPATWGLNRNITRKGKWVKERYYNARSETIHRLSVFKEAFLERRCLVPASAFFERDEGYKDWFRFYSMDGSPLLFAGIYDAPLEEGAQFTYAFATSEPNAVVAQLHDRAPVCLSVDEAKVWLDPAAGVDDLRAVLAPAPEILRYEWAEPVQRGPKPKNQEELF